VNGRGGKAKAVKKYAAIAGVEYIPYIDSKGKTVTKRYTTRNLIKAMERYITLTEAAPIHISRILQALSTVLNKDNLFTIIQTTHYTVILQAINSHVAAARQQAWSLPSLVSFSEGISSYKDQSPLEIAGLTPYWLHRDRAVANTMTLKGLFLLTAPNMSGKSTLMRSVLVIALLANCGLFVPAERAAVPRFDTFFLRTASYDVPSEAKSAFALEMDDMRVVLRDCTSRSLVMIDELGKGTSARDGSALAGALLEHLDNKAVYGIFATHLHELFLLPLNLHHVVNKKMGFLEDQTGKYMHCRHATKTC
jgi:DNA mismatch repair ATPase MutS